MNASAPTPATDKNPASIPFHSATILQMWRAAISANNIPVVAR
jgi:hypothetical protein